MRLAYGPDVPDALLAMVEHHGKRIGLPLHLLEQMGASLDVAERFVLAAEDGLGLAFAMATVYGAPAEPGADPVRVLQPSLGALPRARRAGSPRW